MAKIHTHYDNLKVARMAPQEVIRAAYKALSQKYHPDKNPGDEKAARIMAIVNTAYGILADPVRRREHDEWIAAEEWEIAWLESSEEGGKGRDGAAGAGWEPQPVPAAPRARLLREPLLWLAMAAVFTVGCVVGALALPPVGIARVEMVRPLSPPARQAADDVVAPQRAAAAAPAPATAASDPLHTLAVTQLAVPAAGDCSTVLRGAQAPNGMPWPAASGYVDGYPVANLGEQMRFEVDNSANASAVFVRLLDMERGAGVRHAYILPHESLSIDKLAAGRYELRYQNVDAANSGVPACTLALKQSTASP